MTPRYFPPAVNCNNVGLFNFQWLEKKVARLIGEKRTNTTTTKKGPGGVASSRTWSTSSLLFSSIILFYDHLLNGMQLDVSKLLFSDEWASLTIASFLALLFFFSLSFILAVFFNILQYIVERHQKGVEMQHASHQDTSLFIFHVVFFFFSLSPSLSLCLCLFFSK